MVETQVVLDSISLSDPLMKDGFSNFTSCRKSIDFVAISSKFKVTRDVFSWNIIMGYLYWYRELKFLSICISNLVNCGRWCRLVIM